MFVHFLAGVLKEIPNPIPPKQSARIAGVCPFSSQCFEGDSEPDTSKAKHKYYRIRQPALYVYYFHYAVDVFLGTAMTDALDAVFGVHQCVLQRDDNKVM